MEPLKYSALSVDCTVSSKQKSSAKKPSKSFYDITFASSDARFDFIIFQNFYVASITIKQFCGEETTKYELDQPENWNIVLSNYKLMNNAHFEGDAQNWHIIGREHFNGSLNIENLSVLRVFMNAPSPSWLDFSLKNINLYYKKTHVVFKQEKSKVKKTPFGQFKKMIKENMKVIQKDTTVKGKKNVPEYDQTMDRTDEVRKIELPYRP
ncbi:unnamed protein product [Moneuplotes crassus]|uniref:Uncharacterized protein n=1 Tax=Euplotes crassus TaxID=5936 RepID=A0AAD1XWR6_EUPCR|nr:unnamed protein product [Moneuplotes crassus]